MNFLLAMDKIYMVAMSFVSLMILSSCANVQFKSHQAYENTDTAFAIIQDANRTSFFGSDTLIHLSRAPFKLQFTIGQYSIEKNQKYAAQIATTADSLNRKFFVEGEISKLNPFYSSYGTGFAHYDDREYDQMYVSNSGHHYIYYQNENHRRASFVKKSGNLNTVEWHVDKIQYNDETTAIQKTEIDTIYLMYLNDRNLNDTIESGEFHRVTIVLD